MIVFRGFLQLDKELLKSALNAGNIDAECDRMFDAIVMWAKANTESDDPQALQELVGELLPPKVLFNQKIKYSMLNPSASPIGPYGLLAM